MKLLPLLILTASCSSLGESADAVRTLATESRETSAALRVAAQRIGEAAASARDGVAPVVEASRAVQALAETVRGKVDAAATAIGVPEDGEQARGIFGLVRWAMRNPLEGIGSAAVWVVGILAYFVQRWRRRRTEGDLVQVLRGIEDLPEEVKERAKAAVLQEQAGSTKARDRIRRLKKIGGIA